MAIDKIQTNEEEVNSEDMNQTVNHLLKESPKKTNCKIYVKELGWLNVNEPKKVVLEKRLGTIHKTIITYDGTIVMKENIIAIR